MTVDRPTLAGGQLPSEQLRYQLRLLARHWAAVVVCAVVGAGAGFAYSGTVGHTYQATSQVLVQPITTNPLSSTGSATTPQVNIATERQLALSAAVAQSAAKKLGEPGQAAELDQHLQVTSPAQTSTLSFQFTDKSPAFAAKAANALADAYLAQRRSSAQQQIQSLVAALQDQINPLVKQRKKYDDQLSTMAEGPERDTVTTERSDVASQISTLQAQVTSYQTVVVQPGSVTRQAVPPTTPADQLGRLLLTVIGAAVGSAVGLLLAWLAITLDPRVRTKEEIVTGLGAPILGRLPRKFRPERPWLAIGDLAARNAEAYRSAVLRLAHDPRFEAGRRVLVVAPRGDEDVVGAVAANIAAGLCELGLETLLVEADLRYPRLQQKLPVRVGGSNDRLELMDGWPVGRPLLVDVPGAGAFSFIPGARVDHISRALTSGPVSRVIAQAEDGSAVVVNAPGLLSFSDGLTLTSRVSGVVVVCHAKDTRRADLESVRELIAGAGGSILGSVVYKGRRPGKLLPVPGGRDAAPRVSGAPKPGKAAKQREASGGLGSGPKPTNAPQVGPAAPASAGSGVGGAAGGGLGGVVSGGASGASGASSGKTVKSGSGSGGSGANGAGRGKDDDGSPTPVVIQSTPVDTADFPDSPTQRLR